MKSIWNLSICGNGRCIFFFLGFFFCCLSINDFSFNFLSEDKPKKELEISQSNKLNSKFSSDEVLKSIDYLLEGQGKSKTIEPVTTKYRTFERSLIFR